MISYNKIAIKDIGDVVTGKTPPTTNAEYYDGEYMFISPTELHGGYAITKSEKTITKAGMKSVKSNSIKGTSVLVGCIGWDMGNVAMCFDECATNQQINAITNIKAEYNPYYIYYWLSGKKEYLFSIASVTRTPILSKGTFEDVEVPLPPKTYQDKVVDVLLGIDKKIEKNKQINDNLQQQLKLMHDYWFTQFDYPNKEGKPYRSSGGTMRWNEELKRDIPVGWTVKTLGEILCKNTESFDYKTIQPAIDLSVMPSDTIALSQLNSSENFNTNLFVMKQGDILFGSIRPYLHKAGFAPIDGVVAGTVHSYRVKNPTDYNFALFTLCRNAFFDYAVNVSSGTKMPVISSDSLLSYKLPYSEEIAAAFNQVAIVDTISQNIQETIRLNNLRNFLLPMLMNGQATIID